MWGELVKHKAIFLLFLYIGTVILLPSCYGLPIAAEPQATKDFSISAGESWLTGWNYRKQLDLDPVGDCSYQNFTYYQIELDVNYGSGSDSGNSIYCNSHGQTDFDDVRFTDDDGNTELDYWIEEKTDSDDATFWVEVADSLSSAQTIFIYYGNSTVSTTSDADETFVFFDDFESGNLDKWTNNGCTIESSIVHTGTYSCKLPNTGVDLRGYFGPYTFGMMFHAQIHNDNSYRGLQMRAASYEYGDVTILVRQYESVTSKIYLHDGSYKAWPNCSDIYDDDTWYKHEVGIDNDYGHGAGEDPRMRLFMEDSYIGEEEFYEGDGTYWETQNVGEIRFVGQSSYTGYIDDVWVRKWSKLEPEISAFGEEEDNREWQDINTATFYIVIDMSPATRWAFENIIATVGLAMFVGSGIFLVYGGKEKLSMDKLLYAIVLFMVGLGLFIGGITP